MSAGFITLIALPLQIIFRSAPTSIAYLTGLFSGLISTTLVIAPFYLFPSFSSYIGSTFWSHVTFAILGFVFSFLSAGECGLTVRSTRTRFVPPTTWQIKLAMLLAPLRRSG